MRGPIAEKAHEIADSSRFQLFIAGVIVFNALVLGLETYGTIDDEYGQLLTILNDVCLGVFVVEIGIRIVSYGSRPQDFFKDGWNVFDFVIIGAVFIPGLRQNATLLRLVRLLRVVRLVSVLPDLRVLIRGMVGALAPIGSMAVLGFLLIYVYGMLGWILFGEELPAEWGDIGQSMLTLFTILTLEGWPDLLRAGMEVHPWSWIYFVSFVLMASLLLANLLIAVIITATEEAHHAQRAEDTEERIRAAEAEGGEAAHRAETERRLEALKRAIGELEDQLRATDRA